MISLWYIILYRFVSYAQMVYATDSATRAVTITYETTITSDTISADNIVNDTIVTAVENVYEGLDLSDSFCISAESAAPHFTECVNSITDHAPIVIMSHIPIHANRKDNPGAYTWYKAISKAAETHDILLLFGHNHTLEERGNPADGYDYLL